MNASRSHPVPQECVCCSPILKVLLAPGLWLWQMRCSSHRPVSFLVTNLRVLQRNLQYRKVKNCVSALREKRSDRERVRETVKYILTEIGQSEARKNLSRIFVKASPEASGWKNEQVGHYISPCCSRWLGTLVLHRAVGAVEDKDCDNVNANTSVFQMGFQLKPFYMLAFRAKMNWEEKCVFVFRNQGRRGEFKWDTPL